jgi:cytochrome c oxidase subunit 3/cytochrome o ubiquinol oxidase subunit 3
MQDDAAISIEPEFAAWQLVSRRKVGVICLIITESVLFAIFVAAYVFYIGKSLTGPLPAQVLELPLLATFCLLSSSITIALAVRAFKRGRPASFKRWWAVTILLAAAFLTMTALEWHRLIYRQGLTISTNLFGTTFYSLVGLHASHVIVGLILLSLVFALSLRGLVWASDGERIEMVSWYWHFVDVIWVVVLSVVYIIGR